jgi:hypothetical protein
VVHCTTAKAGRRKALLAQQSKGVFVGRLTEYFGRLNQRSRRRNHSLPEHIEALCYRIRRGKVDPAKVAEREARQHLVAKPGPLDPDWTPDGLTARQLAAARATQALVKMKQCGETASLARQFDKQCAVIDDEDGDLGPIIRGKVFDWDGPETDYEPNRSKVTELCGSDLWMTVRTR